jgi:lipid-A-disaccharide synthase
MKYYLIAGEASGDLHGSNLMREIKQRDAAADFRYWGGDLMAAEGGVLVKHYAELAFMGFVEVIANLRTIFKNIDYCKTDILAFAPDAIIFIDYPGFNLRIAKWAKEKKIPTIYYISPQVWAWKENRVNAIKRDIDKMLVILPFEKSFYKKWQYAVEYVGHPLAEVIDQFVGEHTTILPQQKIIALLPGSRKQEILKKLPVMLNLSSSFPDYSFVVAKAPGQPDEFYAPLLAPFPNVTAVRNETYALLMKSRAALVTSGTATLETALFGVPEVVCYKGSSISYQIARRLIKVKYISLVNLIMDRMIVKELIQDELNEKNLRVELKKILEDETERRRLKADYASLKSLLQQGGNASAQAAESITRFMRV